MSVAAVAAAACAIVAPAAGAAPATGAAPAVACAVACVNLAAAAAAAAAATAACAIPAATLVARPISGGACPPGGPGGGGRTGGDGVYSVPAAPPSPGVQLCGEKLAVHATADSCAAGSRTPGAALAGGSAAFAAADFSMDAIAALTSVVLPKVLPGTSRRPNLNGPTTEVAEVLGPKMESTTALISVVLGAGGAGGGLTMAMLPGTPMYGDGGGGAWLPPAPTSAGKVTAGATVDAGGGLQVVVAGAATATRTGGCEGSKGSGGPSDALTGGVDGYS